jgi:hypothetical protein
MNLPMIIQTMNPTNESNESDASADEAKEQ